MCSSDLALIINREEPGKFDHLPGRAKLVLAGAFAQGHAGPFDHGRGHLAGNRALPHQLVEPRFVAAAELVLAEIGRADRLVGFLSILGLGFVNTRFFRQVVATKRGSMSWCGSARSPVRWPLQ